jgi:hypothetical protein
VYHSGPNRTPAQANEPNRTPAQADELKPEQPKTERTKDSRESLYEQARVWIRAGDVQQADRALHDYIIDPGAPNRDEALRLLAEIRSAQSTLRARNLAQSMDDAQLKRHIENGVDDLTRDGDIQTPELRRVYAKTLADAFRAEFDSRARRPTQRDPTDPGLSRNGKLEDGYMRLVTGENLELWVRDPGQIVRLQGEQIVSTGTDGSFTTRKPYKLASFRFDYLTEPSPAPRLAQGRGGTVRAFVRIVLDKPVPFFGSTDLVNRIELAFTSGDAGKISLFHRNGRRRVENPIIGGEPAPGKWHNAEIRCEEHNLRFLIDDQELNHLELDRTMSSYVGFHFASGQDVSGQVHLANLRLSEQKLPGAGRRELPRGARAFAGKHFLIVKQKLSWTGAQDMCRSIGGHLAMVRDEAENRFLTSCLLGEGLDGAWLGATNKNKAREWFWVDGTRVKYTNWDRNKGQPDDLFGLEYYLLLSAKPGANGTWFDEREDKVHGFVCEWDY